MNDTVINLMIKYFSIGKCWLASGEIAYFNNTSLDFPSKNIL